MSTTPPQRPSWPTPTPPAPLDLEALAAYERLSREERARSPGSSA